MVAALPQFVPPVKVPLRQDWSVKEPRAVVPAGTTTSVTLYSAPVLRPKLLDVTVAALVAARETALDSSYVPLALVAA